MLYPSSLPPGFPALALYSIFWSHPLLHCPYFYVESFSFSHSRILSFSHSPILSASSSLILSFLLFHSCKNLPVHSAHKSCQPLGSLPLFFSWPAQATSLALGLPATADVPAWSLLAFDCCCWGGKSSNLGGLFLVLLACWLLGPRRAVSGFAVLLAPWPSGL